MNSINCEYCHRSCTHTCKPHKPAFKPKLASKSASHRTGSPYLGSYLVKPFLVNLIVQSLANRAWRAHNKKIYASFKRGGFCAHINFLSYYIYLCKPLTPMPSIPSFKTSAYPLCVVRNLKTTDTAHHDRQKFFGTLRNFNSKIHRIIAVWISF